MNAPTPPEIALDLAPLWKPFTANRAFKAAPRLLVAAEGMYYTSHDGRRILDGTAGLWCVNAGHARPEIVSAIKRQAETLDYAPPFQMGHPVEFEAAARADRIQPCLLLQLRFGGGGQRAQDRPRLPPRTR